MVCKNRKNIDNIIDIILHILVNFILYNILQVKYVVVSIHAVFDSPNLRTRAHSVADP